MNEIETILTGRLTKCGGMGMEGEDAMTRRAEHNGGAGDMDKDAMTNWADRRLPARHGGPLRRVVEA